MIANTALAPAKINLTLHVTGQRDDGYHLLDSLVVFLDLGDGLRVGPAPDLRLSVTGPFKMGVPTNHNNLAMRAAQMLAQATGATRGAALTLDKLLPHAAGIGGGSADAALTLRLLADFWNVDLADLTLDEIVALGADVPVCLAGPGPLRMRGVGDDLSTVAKLPDCALVLVKPDVDVATPAIFQALRQKNNAAMDDLPSGLDLEGFAAWLDTQRNDLLPPARDLAPDIAVALDGLRRLPQVKAVGMSGSGATCWGLTAHTADAKTAAKSMQLKHPRWWVAPGGVLQTSRATT
ncbi:4-(cytidine 5'-diphospho)-2-C-methyl-D-erythritol kinase [Loktanella sp. SALINAS62]|uniref:4-(cytidine 5'-diphospho)-2-C-methyl-D-erythritol kinase n=1 Tax=Loktanella sp. SALINAS62 TaxID=2706124 RepID=UPI001B8D0BAD|nr:4-(cytidine 5'-diphospho)-2-C-methyl-D-erythritol kinase [Loktanella sp. SALINAS62]MBS1302095.1 4-(cytidine 5'-diphospho)-2-C-methyl-D-erythritol kinase [Loktanella sp. SALINAS62]